MPSYSYTNLLNEVIDSARRSNITNVITARTPINRAVREVISELDLRSTKRNAALASKLFDEVYEYAAPADLKGEAVIDFDPQVNRSKDFRLDLVSEQEFRQKKEIKRNIVAVASDDMVNKILFSGDVKDVVLPGPSTNSLSVDGVTWTAYSDATNVVLDSVNYVSGYGSIKFDLTGSTTTAGIYAGGFNSLDISEYTNDGVIFVWVYINSTTNLTNFILDIGNDLTTNYYTQTITTNNEGSAFYNGWNLLRFSFASMTENGTVDDEAIDSIRLYMTKSAGKSDDGYRVCGFSFHTGEIHNCLYYSKYGWQTSSGTWIENSTADTDLLNADTEEFDGFVFKGKAELFKELRRFDLAKEAQNDWINWKKEYLKKHPSEKVTRNKFYHNPILNYRKF